MNVHADVRINGHRLPDSLCALMNEGRWRCPEDTSRIDNVFPEHGDIRFYSLDQMQFQTNDFETAAVTCHVTDLPEMIGIADERKPPGDIDARHSVVIADLGMGYDQPIALDYRTSEIDPSVVTFQWSPCGDENRWVRIADNVAQLAERLGL
jgi:hypothetical protein